MPGRRVPPARVVNTGNCSRKTLRPGASSGKAHLANFFLRFPTRSKLMRGAAVLCSEGRLRDTGAAFRSGNPFMGLKAHLLVGRPLLLPESRPMDATVGADFGQRR